MKRGLVLAFVLLMAACGDDGPSGPGGASDLELLPPDTGGVQTAIPRDPNDATAPVYGTHVYVPAGADTSPVPYPVLVFLHGSGERGDSFGAPGALDMVLRNGPPRLIDRDQWDAPYPMIVVSPQCHEGWWSVDSIRALIEWVDANHDVDRSRIYLTGLSMGGFGTWAYLAAYGDVPGDPLPIAAAVPICGGGSPGAAEAIASTPVWAFHGTSDPTVNVSASTSMVKAIGAVGATPAPRLTLYDGVGHDSWSRTYDGSGVGEGIDHFAGDAAVDPWLVPFDEDVFAWMLGYQR